MLYVTFWVVQRYFQTYVFDEIKGIQQTIRRLINGDKKVSFNKSKSREMDGIIAALNEWNNSLQYMQKKLNWIINATNPNAAMFECLSYVQGAYFSDNLQTVLGMEQEQWEDINGSVDKFRAYFSALEEEKNDKGIVEEGGKHLLLRLYHMDQDYFGIIVDKTDSVRRKERQASELRQGRG